MNLRHAAALTLVGWYLMLPPVIDPAKTGSPGPLDVDFDAPLSQWPISQRFDNWDDCKKALTTFTSGVQNGIYPVKIPSTLTPAQIQNSKQNFGFGYSFARCVESNNPGLTAK